MLKFMEHQQRDHAGACGNPLFPVGKQRTSIRYSTVCAPRETMTAPKPSRFGRCCVTALRTRTCSSCACGYLGKKEELNTKILSQTAAYN